MPDRKLPQDAIIWVETWRGWHSVNPTGKPALYRYSFEQLSGLNKITSMQAMPFMDAYGHLCTEVEKDLRNDARLNEDDRPPPPDRLEARE
jgi:hypothetical protein